MGRVNGKPQPGEGNQLECENRYGTNRYVLPGFSRRLVA